MVKPASRGASKNSSENRQSNFGSGMLLTGFVLGVVATLGGQWLLSSGFSGDADPVADAENASTEADFEFYTLLGDIEVEVPEASAISAEEDDIIYWLQVGSFRNPEDAEGMRYRIINNAVAGSGITTLTLNTVHGRTVPTSAVLSLIRLYRFDSDIFEIEHTNSPHGFISSFSASVVEVVE